MLQGYQSTIPLQQVADAIWSGDAIIGTNGSAANNHGTFSFIILTDVDNKTPTAAVKCGVTCQILQNMSTWTHTAPKEQLFSWHSALYDSF
jgi:hypothetical protein